MQKLRSLVFLFFCILTFPVFSQPMLVKGKVLDATDNSPIIGVNIIVKGTTIGTTTNKNGEFTLKLPKTEKLALRISFTGYSTLEKEVDGISEQSLLLVMEQTPFDLNAVVVTGTRTEKNMKDVPVLTQVISSKRLDAISTNNIQNILELTIPNISFTKAGYGTRMAMQGLDAKYMVFLIDGEKMAGETNGNIDYSRINTDNIEQIEIIRGASSSLYGSNAMGAVINIITKDVKQPVEVSIKSRYNSLEDLNYGGTVGFRFGKFTSKTEYEHKYITGYDLTPETNLDWTVDQYKGFSLNQKFGWNPTSKIRVKLKGGYYENFRFDGNAGDLIHKKYSDLNGQIKIDYLYGVANKFEMSMFSDKYQIQNVAEALDNQLFLISNDFVNVGRITNTMAIGAYHFVTSGIEANSEKMLNDRIDGTTKSALDLNAFVQDELKISPKLTSIAGFRFNNHSVYGLHFTPQVSLMYKMSSFKFRASYSSGYKAPTLKELYMYYSPVPVIEIRGNKDLKPETSNYGSLSAEFSKASVNISVMGFYNYINNLITEVNDVNDTRVWTYMNVSKARTYGVELQSSFKTAFGLSLNCAYTYNRARTDTSNNQIWGTYKHSATGSLDYSIRHKNYSFSMNLTGKLLGQMFFQEVDETTGIQSEKNIPTHSLWKFSVSQKVLSGIMFTAGIDNVLDYHDKELFISLNPGRTYFVSFQMDVHKFLF